MPKSKATKRADGDTNPIEMTSVARMLGGALLDSDENAALYTGKMKRARAVGELKSILGEARHAQLLGTLKELNHSVTSPSGVKPLVLDLGCGEAVAVREISQKYANLHVIGVDLDAVPAMGAGYTIHKDDLTELAHVADNSVSLAYSCAVLDYVSDKLKALLKIWQKLAPGGQAIISTTPDQFGPCALAMFPDGDDICWDGDKLALRLVKRKENLLDLTCAHYQFVPLPADVPEHYRIGPRAAPAFTRTRYMKIMVMWPLVSDRPEPLYYPVGYYRGTQQSLYIPLAFKMPEVVRVDTMAQAIQLAVMTRPDSKEKEAVSSLDTQEILPEPDGEHAVEELAHEVLAVGSIAMGSGTGGVAGEELEIKEAVEPISSEPKFTAEVVQALFSFGLHNSKAYPPEMLDNKLSERVVSRVKSTSEGIARSHRGCLRR